MEYCLFVLGLTRASSQINDGSTLSFVIIGHSEQETGLASSHGHLIIHKMARKIHLGEIPGSNRLFKAGIPNHYELHNAMEHI